MELSSVLYDIDSPPVSRLDNASPLLAIGTVSALQYRQGCLLQLTLCIKAQRISRELSVAAYSVYPGCDSCNLYDSQKGTPYRLTQDVQLQVTTIGDARRVGSEKKRKQ